MQAGQAAAVRSFAERNSQKVEEAFVGGLRQPHFGGAHKAARGWDESGLGPEVVPGAAQIPRPRVFSDMQAAQPRPPQPQPRGVPAARGAPPQLPAGAEARQNRIDRENEARAASAHPCRLRQPPRRSLPTCSTPQGQHTPRTCNTQPPPTAQALAHRLASIEAQKPRQRATSAAPTFSREAARDRVRRLKEKELEQENLRLYKRITARAPQPRAGRPAPRRCAAQRAQCRAWSLAGSGGSRVLEQAPSPPPGACRGFGQRSKTRRQCRRCRKSCTASSQGRRGPSLSGRSGERFCRNGCPPLC